MIQPGAEEQFAYGHTKIGMMGSATLSVGNSARILPVFTFHLKCQGAGLYYKRQHGLRYIDSEQPLVATLVTSLYWPEMPHYLQPSAAHHSSCVPSFSTLLLTTSCSV